MKVINTPYHTEMSNTELNIDSWIYCFLNPDVTTIYLWNCIGFRVLHWSKYFRNIMFLSNGSCNCMFRVNRIDIYTSEVRLNLV